MAITGNGLITNPWHITTLADLKDVAARKVDNYSTAGRGGYIVLDADINCNEQCPDGWTTITTAHNIDLNGHAIIAPLIKDGNNLFFNNAIDSKISNGYIHNIYTDFTGEGKIFRSGNYTSYGYLLENLQISFRGRGENVCSKARKINKCQIEISGKVGTNGYPLFQCPSSADTVTGSRFILDYTSNNVLLLLPVSSNYTVSNCMFEGKGKNLSINSEADQPGGANQGYIKSSIIAFTPSEQSVGRGYTLSGNCLVLDNGNNKMAVRFNTSSSAALISDADLKSVQKVTEAGFTVIEVV